MLFIYSCRLIASVNTIGLFVFANSNINSAISIKISKNHKKQMDQFYSNANKFPIPLRFNVNNALGFFYVT